MNNIFCFLVGLGLITSCNPFPNSASDTPAIKLELKKNQNPPDVVKPAFDEIYKTGYELVKSTLNNSKKNTATVEFTDFKKKALVSVPFYFKAEKFLNITVKLPVFVTEGCSSESIILPEFNFPKTEANSLKILGWSKGRVPGKPAQSIGYEIKEKANLEEDPDSLIEQTLSVQFYVPIECKRITFSFEALFE